MQVFIILILIAVACSALATPIDEIQTQDGEIKPLLTFIGNADGKSFFIETSTRLTWIGANERCNGMGMRLVSITSQAQYAALGSSTASEFVHGSCFWTSGRDSYKMRQFDWNEPGTEITAPYLSWATSNSPYRTCVTYLKGDNKGLLTYDTCTNNCFTICEI